MEPRTIWAPQKGPQQALLACPIFEVLFGGARGGGKTDAMLGEFASHAAQYGQDAIGLCVRRERTQLMEMIERSKQIYTPLKAKYVHQDKMWRFPNGARLTFAYLENDADAEAYQGHNYSRIYVEEMGNFPRSEPILKLMATLRSPNPDVRVGFRATANPGGPGHLWIRQRYIDPNPKGMKPIEDVFTNPFTNKAIPIERVFIPSRVTDNRYCNNPQYIAQLQLSAGKRLLHAWLYGDWSIIEGAFFEEWDESKHIIEPFVIPEHWTRFMSADWGSAHPFAIHWWAVVPEEDIDAPITIGPFSRPKKMAYQGGLPAGAIVCYREWYGSANHNNTGLKLHAEEVAVGIRERERDEPRFESGRARIAYRVIDPDATKDKGGPTIAERMGYAPNYIYWRAADNARVGKRGNLGGWDAVRGRLSGVNGKPMMYIFDTCIDIIRTIPVAQHDPDNPEDMDECEDHCLSGDTIVDIWGQGLPLTIRELAKKFPDWGFVYSVEGIVRYENCRLTQRNAKVVKVVFEDGREIVCTPDHKFLVDLDTWRYAKDLVGSEVLCSQLLSQAPFRSSLGSGTISVGGTSKRSVDASILQFGNIIMGLGQKAMTSIIETKIVRTTIQTIWNVLTSSRITVLDMAAAQIGSRPNLMQMPLFGTDRRTGISGTNRIMRMSEISGWLQLPRFVSNAVSNIKQYLRGLQSQNSAISIVERVRCVRVEELSERQDVYCLTVPKNQTFSVEGGILVHNCLDSIRYACLSRPYVTQREVKEPQRFMTIGPENQLTINDVMLDHDHSNRPVPRYERIL